MAKETKDKMLHVKHIEGIKLYIDYNACTITVKRGRGSIIEHYKPEMTEKEIDKLCETIAKELHRWTKANQ